MVSSSQIKQRLALYLAKQLSFAQFENWFVPNTRDVRKTHSEAAIALTFAIEGTVSDYLSEVLNEQELRSELLQILNADNKVVDIVDTPQTIYAFRSSSPSRLLPVKV